MENRKRNNKLLADMSLFIFLMLSLILYSQFISFGGEKIIVPIPGAMSTVSPYIKHLYTERFDKDKPLQVDIEYCDALGSICVPCSQCEVDLYYNYDNEKQLYEKNISVNKNGSIFIEIRTIPTWLSVSLNNTYMGDLRIPKANVIDYVIEKLKDYTYKLTFLVTWLWLVSFLENIIIRLKYLIKCYKEKKNKQEDKPNYIG